MEVKVSQDEKAELPMEVRAVQSERSMEVSPLLGLDKEPAKADLAIWVTMYSLPFSVTEYGMTASPTNEVLSPTAHVPSWLSPDGSVRML